MTQISQVAFSMRQKKRAFDQAGLLEVLTENLLKDNRRCLVSPIDLNKGVTDFKESTSFILTKQAKVV